MKKGSLFLLLIIFVPSVFNCSYGQVSKWSTQIENANIFSSPRFADLNKDNVLDVIVGAGIESVESLNGVVAFDGKTGNLLWNIKTRTQIYTSALFQDITNDGTPDVFIAGRDATFFAIDGLNGKIIWEFWPTEKGAARKEGWLNFFTTQLVEDQNKDGFMDILTTNGGDYLAMPNEKNRPTAQLMILCSKTGKVISSAKFPEKKESYYAPHTYLNDINETMIIFGTGGETVDGALWQVPLKKLVQGNISKSELIARDDKKGFILNTLMADLNEDGTSDLITARMSSAIGALDGKTFKTLWEHSFKGYECYVTPSMGQLTGDETPDIFTIIAKGTFPMYTSFKLIVIDGKTGNIAWQEDSGFNQFSPAVIADWNGDLIDEIIYVENTLIDPEKFSVVNQVRVVDIKNNQNWYVGPVRNGVSMAASPGLLDLDNDGNLELVIATSSIVPEGSTPFSIVQCIDLKRSIKTINWNGYLGSNENGEY
jgi:outer membrane protein assembly factor BamB